MQFIIKTLEGLEPVLANEVEDIGLSNIEILKRAVSCEGNWAQLYKCNYLLQTALRVLLPIKTFKVTTEKQLYDAVYSIDWTKYIPKKKSMAINATVSGDIFTHSQYVTFKTKDAIVDQLREKYDQRPSIDTKSPDCLIDILLRQDELKVSIDSSGRSLHLRKYKLRQYQAPLNEVLAAGIIKLSGWNGKTNFHDPMCGSGTFVTEAMIHAAKIPPGMFHPYYAFQNWTEYYPEIWKMVKESGDAAITNPECKISASDSHRMAVRDTKKNLQRFPFKENLHVFQRDFFTMEGKPGYSLFINPPYDRRISVANVTEFYKRIGDSLKQRWQGSEAWIISSNVRAMKALGLRPHKKIMLNHGGSEALLYNYEIYEGSKKLRHHE